MPYLSLGVLYATVTGVIAATAPSNDPNTFDAPPPSFAGFVVKVATSREEASPSVSARETVEGVVKSVMTGPWLVRDAAPIEGAFELLPPVLESTSAAMSPRDAWDVAHRLRSDPRFEYAEPMFAVPGAPGEAEAESECVPVSLAESGSQVSSNPGRPDTEWSLGPRGANILEAWKTFGTEAPGHDVWIGHPDTGYRKHPEIWSDRDSAVRPDLGWDFVDNDDDPADAFVEGLLRWPGHGTRTASVIVSPRGRQLEGPGELGISGVAPGAHVIPLRVANGVVLFTPLNLARAIQAATGSDHTRVKQKVDVVSISLGGPPSRALEDAVRLAEQRGVIVVAAAGNRVKTVVWPARYPNVIAVAASNVDGRAWSGSSGGRAVAIGAPGESVWVASPEMKAGAAVNCIGTSDGTSYGTATVAGIAALWVSKHRDEARFVALASSGRLTDTFRSLLQATARRGTDWNTERFGRGIVDATAMLAAPLPTSGGGEEAAPHDSRCTRDLAALESLFELAPDPRKRAASLLGRRPGQECNAASLADEVAFLYATDPSVSRALESLMSAREPQPSEYSAARNSLRGVGSGALSRGLGR